MALVVETGSGSATANSYASVASADEYVADRNVASWAGLDDAAKEAALILATDYLEATYASGWRGDRVSGVQALSWPRSGVVVHGFSIAASVIPASVVKACIEMAIRAGAGDTLLADQGQRVKREKIDVIEVEYQDVSDPTQRYPLVNRMLAPYLMGTTEAGFSTAKLRRV